MNLEKIKEALEAINSKLFPVAIEEKTDVAVEMAEEPEAEKAAESEPETEKSEMEQMQDEMIKLAEMVATLVERVSALEGSNEEVAKENAELSAKLSALENTPAQETAVLSTQPAKLSKAQKRLKDLGII